MKKSVNKKNKKNQAKSSAFSALGQSLGKKVAASPVATSIQISLLICAVLTTLGGIYAWRTFVVAERQTQLEQFAEYNARVAASNVANFIHGAHNKLRFFQYSSTLVDALNNDDRAALLEVQKALSERFPKADFIRIHKIGTAKVDLDGDPPLRFAEVEAIKTAERSEAVLPEAIKVGASQWQINFVVPVAKTENSPVLGTIMITLPITELYDSLRQGLENIGKVSLYQIFDNKPRLMASFGEGSLLKAERIAVPESRWQVEFVASQALYNNTHIDYTLMAIVGSISVIASFGLFAFVGLLIGRAKLKRQQTIDETYQKMGTRPVAEDQDDDLLGVALRDEDRELLGGDEDELTTEASPNANVKQAAVAADEPPIDERSIPEHIFRSYDIRGIAEKEITKELVHDIGRALGSEALDQGEKALIVARDARIHSPIYMENLIRGVMSTGCNVINIGTVPTPLLYFATEVLEQSASGVVITASHSPAEFNGFKMVINGQPRTEQGIKSVRTRILRNKFRQGIGREESLDIVDRYIETIFSDVALAGEIRIVVDAGNGVTGKIAPRLFEELGCEITPLYCDLDGQFPNHGPDPSVVANLQDLINKVKELDADLGVAFDGDGDRLAVVTPKGEIIWPDRLLMLFAKDILSRNPGADVVFDVKSSRQLVNVISAQGGRPIMWKTGHAPMRAKMVETGALCGGEFSGHIFIKDRWYGFDDGMYAAARLIEIMSLRDESLDEIFAEFPSLCSTPEYRFAVAEDKKFDLIEKVAKQGDFGDAKLITLDGVRAEQPWGWGVLRASNTGAEITMRFEADKPEQIHELKSLFTREIHKIDSAIEIKWPA